ncbi:N-acetyltransferase [Myxococcus sp. AB025B]|uniref:GNAT family N-acetyltransferase n=1 Tax=Myxococcus sp. AB025B TaxID=2562794 RepID=UPI001142DD06|nr:GNAT family N-acetyltransferase [Myxococcus sp. AB025B]
MSVSIESLRPELLGQVGPMCARAFDDYPFLAELFPGPSERRARVSAGFYRTTVEDCLAHGVVHATVEDGRLTGVAAWLRPGGFPQSLGRQAVFLPTVWAGLRYFPGRARLALQALARLERYHPHTPPHWYLATIAVDPAHQGKGVGARLMRAGLTLAEETRAPCFLETAKASNRDWYQGFGFDLRRTEPCFDGGPPQWFMWRPAPAHEAPRADSEVARSTWGA